MSRFDLMRPVRAVGALAVLAAVIVGPAHADSAAKLREALDITEVRKSMESYPEDLSASLTEVPDADLGDVRREDLEALAERHFNGDALTEDIFQRMLGKVADAHLDEVIAFYRSDVGQRMVRLEVASAAPGEAERIQMEGPELYRRAAEDDPDRVEFYDRIAESIGLEDLMTAMTMNMSYAMISGMAGSAALPQALTDEQIIAIVNAQADQMREYVRDFVRGMFAYTYRDASKRDLAAYAEYAETEAGRAFNEAMVAAIQGALVDRMRAFGHELMVLRGVRRS